MQYFAKEPFDATVTAFAPLPARDHCNHQSLLLQPLLLMLPEMLVYHTLQRSSEKGNAVKPRNTILGPLVCSVYPICIAITPERYCFFRYTRYLTIFHLMQYYRDIFTIFFKCKLGQNAPKFHSWSAYVEIFATKWPTCGIFIRKHHTLGFFLH